MDLDPPLSFQGEGSEFHLPPPQGRNPINYKKGVEV